MAIFLALVTAAMFGVGDFFGGVATKRARVLQVVAGSHLVGAIGATLIAVIVAERFDWGDIGLGVVGGGFGVVGVALLYRRLAAGPMSVVAPITAIASAVVPAAWGIRSGDELNSLGWAGVGFGLVAIVLVSLVPSGAEPTTGDTTTGDTATGDAATGDAPAVHSTAVHSANSAPVTVQVILESLLAGVGFGTMFIFLDATDASSAPWPVAGARVFTASLTIGLLAILSRRSRTSLAPPERITWLLIAIVGLLDTGSNATFLYATNSGRLTVVSILASLYPVSTLILARFVLGERMNRFQAIGFGVALAATVLLGLG